MGAKNFRYDSSSIKSAFTLVELIIVISILSILALIAIMLFSSQTLKGNDARRKSDINRIAIAIEEYEKDHNCYPPYVICGVHPTQPIYPYLNNVPCDPITNASYFYEDQSASCPLWFRIYTVLQYTQDPVAIPGIGPNSSFNYVQGSANAPSVSANSTPPPGTGGGGSPNAQYYGCRSGVCVPILWNPNRPGPECDPSFQDSNCYGQCGPSSVECVQVP